MTPSGSRPESVPQLRPMRTRRRNGGAEEERRGTVHGRWSETEHHDFLVAVVARGRAWADVSQAVGTRTALQAQAHAQKHFARMTADGT